MNPPLTCTCGVDAPAEAWSCPLLGRDDGDHVLVMPAPERWRVDRTEQNPFLRYRSMLWVHREASSHGLSDDRYVDLVGRFDARVGAVDGRRFVVTPTDPVPALSAMGGGRVWLKDETGNVSGSHKSRHVGGLMIGLLAREAAGRLGPRPPLAIASCGNAALAAAVVAAAARWPITVFVPPDGDPHTLARLGDLDATVVRCPRDDRPGDPTYRAFRAAVAGGAVPFGCQGPDNGRTIDGGRTLGWEMAEQASQLDRVIIHVGGGALASGLFQGLASAARVGPLERTPVFDTVQTEGCAPLARALIRTGEVGGLEAARRDRTQVMWPWPNPHSIATGILDDETYDWYAAVDGMLATGGRAVVVGDELVAEANRLVRTHTAMTPCLTGTAGVAGWLAQARAGAIGQDEEVGLVITGIDRSEERP